MDGANHSVDLVQSLRNVRLQLEIINAGVAVAAIALHHQNVDHDEDVARVLEHCVGSRLWDQIGHITALIAKLHPASDESPSHEAGGQAGPRRGEISEPMRHLDAYSLSRPRVCLVATNDATDDHPFPVPSEHENT